MAPPLFSRPGLVACPSCRVHIRRTERQCPQCGASLGVRGQIAAARVLPIVLGLLLSACSDDGGAADGDGTDTAADDTTAGTTATSMSTLSVGDTSATSTDGTTDPGDTFGDEAAYGVVDVDEGPIDTGTDTGSGTDSDSGSDSGTTGGSDSGTDSGSDSGSTDGGSSGSSSGGIEPAYGVGGT